MDENARGEEDNKDRRRHAADRDTAEQRQEFVGWQADRTEQPGLTERECKERWPIG